MKDREEEVFTCPHCGNKTSHVIIGKHSKKILLDFDNATGEEILANIYYLFFECSTCKNITVKEINFDQVDDPIYTDFDKVRTLYPQERKFPINMPRNIVTCYREAIKVKTISPLAFSILIRKALEVLFIDQKVQRKTLDNKIKFMASKNILPEIFIKMADSIRLFDNLSAHEIDAQITSDQVNSLDYFFNAVVEYVYIAPDKIRKIEESLNRSKQK